MTSEEMKLIKFETIITNLCKKFGEVYRYKYFNNYDENKNPLKYLLGKNSNNKYVQIILDNSFNKEIITQTVKDSSSGSRFSFAFKDLDYSDKNITIKELIDACSESVDDNFYINDFGGQIIFFALMTIAIDNELYNEKVSIISDMAYLIGFNSEKIKDWVFVVKTVLEGEKIDLDKLNTEEAKEFFYMLVKGGI